MASESSDGLVEHLANGKGGREKREGGEEFRSEEVTLGHVDRSSYNNEGEKTRTSLQSRERVYEEKGRQQDNRVPLFVWRLESFRSPYFSS